MSEEPVTDDPELEVADSASAVGHDIGGFIREQRTLAELSLRRLADLAGVSNPYLSQIERGLRKPSAEILQQLGKALQVSAETMYVQAGMLDGGTSQDQSGLESSIRRSRELTSEQRKALIGVYRSFVIANEMSGSVGEPDSKDDLLDTDESAPAPAKEKEKDSD